MVGKIELKGLGPPGRQYYLVITFCLIFVIGDSSIGGGGRPPAPISPPPGYAYESTSILFMIIRFCMLFCLFALDAYRSDTNGSILYDHAKYVVLLIKVKIVLNNSCNLKS